MNQAMIQLLILAIKLTLMKSLEFCLGKDTINMKFWDKDHNLFKLRNRTTSFGKTYKLRKKKATKDLYLL